MTMDLREILRRMFGGEKKKRSAFETEREAYEFLNKVYRETGGVTPELRRSFEFYQRNVRDECGEFDGAVGSEDFRSSR